MNTVSSTLPILQLGPYLRLPSRGACPWTGLKRSVLERLCVKSARNDYNPPVRSISLKGKGMKRACRVIVTESLLAYFAELERQQQVTPGSTAQ
jgi:hypothetical protein